MDRSSKDMPTYEVDEIVRCNSHQNSGSPKLKAGELYRVGNIRQDGDLDWMASVIDDTGDRLGEFFASRFDPLTMMATITYPTFIAGDRVVCVDANEAAGVLFEGVVYYAERVWDEFGSWKIIVRDDSGKVIQRKSGDDWWYARRFASVNGAASPRPIAASPVVNDKTCPHCKNDRCSSTEKSCWKCGGKL